MFIEFNTHTRYKTTLTSQNTENTFARKKQSLPKSPTLILQKQKTGRVMSHCHDAERLTSTARTEAVPGRRWHGHLGKTAGHGAPRPQSSGSDVDSPGRHARPNLAANHGPKGERPAGPVQPPNGVRQQSQDTCTDSFKGLPDSNQWWCKSKQTTRAGLESQAIDLFHH